MNVLVGLYRPDAGEIRIDGRPASFGSPRDAIAAGIGMVHQHFTLVPSQTVTENILLGLDKPRFRLRLREAEAEVARIAATFGLRVDPGAKIWQLSVGEQQRVEILKLLYRGARILIMDEPTAVLAPQEIEELFATLRSMVADGRSVVFISHKLGEVLAIADRITVMRNGRVTAAGRSPVGATRADLARLMVGRSVLEIRTRRRATPGDVVLDVRGVEARNDRGVMALRGASIQVRAGEIVGIAAVAGNGQGELAEVITGLRAGTGDIRVGGEPLTERHAPRGHQARYRPRAGGPGGDGQRAEPVDRREPHPQALSRCARRARLGRGPRRGTRRRDDDQGALSDRGALDRHACPAAVRRQPPAPDPRPRDRGPAAAADRRAADARARCRRDRGRPPDAPRATRGRRGHPPDLRGAGRDPGARRPGRRDVRGPDRRARSRPSRPTSRRSGC